MRSGGPVNLQPPQRSVPEDYRKPTSGVFTTVTRQPSAGRKPPGKALLPEFPRRDEGASYRQGSLATTLGGGSYALGSSTSTGYGSVVDARSSSATGSYTSGSAGAARSSSVPRPSSRNTSGQPVGSAVAPSGHAGGSAASGPGGMPSHQSPRAATRVPLTPGSILDTLKTPSALPSGAIASLAQRMNSSSGWDYSAGRSQAGGAAGASTVRLKRQAGATATDYATVGATAAPTSHVQSHYPNLPHTTAEQLRAVYVSGPAAGVSISGAAMGVAGTPTTAGRRASAERAPAERGSLSRTNSFSSQGGGSGYAVASAAAAAGAGAVVGGYGTPSAPPMPPSYLQEPSQHQQPSSQPAAQRLAAGTVYASQYTPQYGNTANTVYIPYSSQHGSGSRDGSGSYGAVSAAQAASASPYISQAAGSGAYGSMQGAGPGSAYVSHPAFDRTIGPGHYLPTAVAAGGTPGSSQQQARPASLNVGPSLQLPSFLSAAASPSSANAPSAPPLLPPTLASGIPLSTSQLYQTPLHHAPLPSDYVSRPLQRTSSSSASRGGGSAGAAAPSAPPLPPSGLATSTVRIRTLAVSTLDEEAIASGDGGSNTSLRRLQAQDEQPRWSGTGIPSPSRTSGGGGGVVSPKSMGAHYQYGSSAAGAGAVDPYQQHPNPHAQHPSQQQQQQQQQNTQHPQPPQPLQYQQQQHTHSGGLPIGAALDAGGSSYSSTASATSAASSTNSSKSSAAAAGTGTGVSSASTSRTASSISQRSVADALAPQHPQPQTQQHQQQAQQQQKAGSASSRQTGSDRIANSRVSGASYGSHSSDAVGNLEGDARSPTETLVGIGRTSAVMDAGSGGVGTGAGTLAERSGMAPVFGPLPDLPVVVVPRDTQPGRGCVGLQNLGNTCFMNSILQSLNAVPELVQQFLSPSERHWSSKAVVAPAYSGLVRDMMAGSLGGCVNPSSFLRKVSKHDSRWGDGRQQDSQEFLNSLLEVLQSECNRITTKPVYRELQGKGSEEAQALEAFNYARSWNDSIVDDIFGGLTQSTIQCHACKRVSHTFEPFLGLAVPIPSPSPQGQGDRDGSVGHVSVADCLRAFVESEELEGDDSYKCEACKRRQPHSKRLQIFRPPRVLVLTLKRFAQRPAAPGLFSRFRSPAKNNTPVRLEPEPLDLTPYCNPLGLRGMCVRGCGAVAPIYQLLAVSHHSGSLDGGHYTAQARSCLDSQWYNFNDSSVRREAARPSGASSSAYVLFYRLATLPSCSL